MKRFWKALGTQALCSMPHSLVHSQVGVSRACCKLTGPPGCFHRKWPGAGAARCRSLWEDGRSSSWVKHGMGTVPARGLGVRPSPPLAFNLEFPGKRLIACSRPCPCHPQMTPSSFIYFKNIFAFISHPFCLQGELHKQFQKEATSSNQLLGFKVEVNIFGKWVLPPALPLPI